MKTKGLINLPQVFEWFGLEQSLIAKIFKKVLKILKENIMSMYKSCFV